MQNALVVGLEKRPILDLIPNENFLLIDDGPMVDAVLASSRTVRELDLETDTFDPLKDIDYRRARELVQVLNATFPEGESTLTRRNSNYQLLKAMLAGDRKLGELIPNPSKETQDAYQQIETLLMSPVLERVLNHGTNLSLTGTMVAKLDRAALGDFDCFVLGNLLVSNYPGTVIIPDFGFYACQFHTRLIRQERLIAGINSFAEVPKLAHQLVLMDTKIGSRATAEDAETLASYCSGFGRGTEGYSTYVRRAMA